MKQPSNQEKGGIIFIGPSGAGKGTMVDEFLKEGFLRLLSATTRPIREGENPMAYKFVSKDEFERMDRDGELLEWEPNPNGYLYGLTKDSMVYALNSGQPFVGDVSMRGIENIKAAGGKLRERIFVVGVLPPNADTKDGLAVLEQRMVSRAPIAYDELQKRKKQARKEIDYCYEEGNCDLVVVNYDDLVQETYRIVRKMYGAWQGIFPTKSIRS